MSQDLIVNVTRVVPPAITPTTIANNVAIQLDVLNPRLASDYQGKHPFDTFDAYIYYLPSTTLLFRADLFTDTLNNDPSTGQKAAYRVISRPEPFPDGHVECIVEQYIGPNT